MNLLCIFAVILAHTTKPVAATANCAKIVLNDRANSTLLVHENQRLSENDYNLVHSNKLDQALFYVGENLTKFKDCRLEICGSSLDFLGSCQQYNSTSSGPTVAPSDIYGKEHNFTLETLHCSCQATFERDCNKFCGWVWNAMIYDDLWNNSCAVLYQETLCNACFFESVVLERKASFSSEHSFVLRSALVRPTCNLTLKNRDVYLESGFYVYLLEFDLNDVSCVCAGDNPLANNLHLYIFLGVVSSFLVAATLACSYRYMLKRVNTLTRTLEDNQEDHQRLLDGDSPQWAELKEQLFEEFQQKLERISISVPEIHNSTGIGEEFFADLQEELEKAVGDRRYLLERTSFQYSINSPLGEGAFSKVHAGKLAHDTDVEVKVAVKKLEWNSEKAEELKNSFLREIKSLVELGNSNENIVLFYGACCENGNLYVLTELCHGGALDKYLETQLRPLYYQTVRAVPSKSVSQPGSSGGYFHPALPEFVRANSLQPNHLMLLTNWCFQIATGMAFLHEKSIMHLDLAVRNILLTENHVVKICDFGLSRNRNLENLENASLETGFSVDAVTPEWSTAFENGEERVDLRFVDVWTFGCVMWQMFNLNEPLYAASGEKVSVEELFFRAHSLLRRKQRLQRPKFANNFIWQQITECWTEDRLSRPTFDELKQILEECLETLRREP